LGFHDEAIIVHDNQPGPVARHLYEQLTAIQFGRAPDPFGWTHTIHVNGG
jgi:branched-chain amino acid aminotransferase